MTSTFTKLNCHCEKFNKFLPPSYLLFELEDKTLIVLPQSVENRVMQFIIVFLFSTDFANITAYTNFFSQTNEIRSTLKTAKILNLNGPKSIK